jgi:solute carrier family 25, member 39/40
MVMYDYLLNSIFPSILPSSISPMTSGMVARTAISSIASPLELIRTNLQSTPLSADQPHTLRSVIQSIRQSVQRQGIHILWRGLGPTLARDVPFSGFYWASYESLKHNLLQQGHEGAYVAFLSGSISGTAAALLTSPTDVLKTRRQALVMSSMETRSLSSIGLLSKIIQTEGVPALFAGATPRIAKIAPACGIMIASFEVSAFTENCLGYILIGLCRVLASS